jgi:putative membrane protein
MLLLAKEYTMFRLAATSLTLFLVLSQVKDAAGGDAGDFLVKGFPICHAQLLYAQHAEKNASRQAVKDFAKSVATDHKEMHKDFAKAAEARKVGVVAGLEKATKDHLEELGRLTAADYDRRYLRLTIDGHKRLIELFETQAKSDRDTGLRDMASQSLTKLRAHLASAQKMLDENK